MIARLHRRIALSLLLLVLTSAWAAPAAHANALCVNQGGTGGCFGTIAAAIAAAGSGDTIHVTAAANTYVERLTIDKSLNLVGDDPGTTIIDANHAGQVIRISGAIVVTLSNLTIRNGQAGLGNTTDQYGGGIHSEAASLTLNNVVVSGNQTGGGNVCCGGNGGGIYNQLGTLNLNHSTVSGNRTGIAVDISGTGTLGGSGGNGAGIYNDSGAVTLNDSTISGNVTGSGAHGTYSGGNGGAGGGIITYGGTLTLNHSTISSNETGNGVTGGTKDGNSGSGGGIYDVLTPLTLNDSTVSSNQTGLGATGGGASGVSGSGAGLYVSGSIQFPFLVTITTSTLSNNLTGRGLFSSAGGDGGGIFSSSKVTVTLTNVTLAYNSMDVGQIGGALANYGGVVYVKNSLLAHNHTPAGPYNLNDCSGSINSLGYNLIMEPFCAITATVGDQFFIGGLIVLPLANNGGPTWTNALPAGSPAVDAADNSTCSPTDQRSFIPRGDPSSFSYIPGAGAVSYTEICAPLFNTGQPFAMAIAASSESALITE